ncbi:MAG: DUF305 domain-containing protein [Ilumatobacteraceae bacterium]|nr:DUF305 domain-containing protein [Ilumatobacteraceae bacterium]
MDHDVELDEQTLSDEALRRILTGMAVAVVAIMAAVVFIAGARWAAADTSEEPYGNADIGFLQDMVDHHEQALQISEIYLDNNPDGDAAPYAREVILFQERDIERMDAWLDEAGVERGAPGRTAMAWMGMPVALEQMPGMQTSARLAALEASTGPQADRLFFDIMSDHHLGGVHMADSAASRARRSEIREFASKMADNQRIEVVEYDQAIRRLGL